MRVTWPLRRASAPSARSVSSTTDSSAITGHTGAVPSAAAMMNRTTVGIEVSRASVSTFEGLILDSTGPSRSAKSHRRFRSRKISAPATIVCSRTYGITPAVTPRSAATATIAICRSHRLRQVAMMLSVSPSQPRRVPIGSTYQYRDTIDRTAAAPTRGTATRRACSGSTSSTTSTTIAAPACRTVLSLPTGRAPASIRRRSSAGRMSPYIAASRAAISAGTHGGSTPRTPRPAKIATNTIASVRASATLPNFETTAKRRATAPSR